MLGRPRFVAAATSIVLTLSLVAVSRAATAVPTVIDFEGLADGTPITDQYAVDGVVIENLVARDYTAEPGFAHSGTGGAVVLPSAEFCTTANVVLRFPKPVTRLKVWFGLPERLSAPGQLILTAFGADQTVVGEVSSPLGQGEGPRAIDAALELLDPLEPVARAQIATKGDIPICDLAFDDLEFDGLGTPADLAIDGAIPSVGSNTVTFAVTVINRGGTSSAPTTVQATSPGWDAATAPVGQIEPGASTLVSLVLAIPSGLAGSTTPFEISADPVAAGDENPANNSLSTDLFVPLQVTSLPPPTAVTQAPTPVATTGPTAPAAGADPGPLVAIIAGVLLLAAGGAAFVARRRGKGETTARLTRSEATLSVKEDGRSVTLTIDGDGIELEAHDREPPERCAAGQFYCEREALFERPRRRVSTIAVASERPRRTPTDLGSELAERATALARAVGHDPNGMPTQRALAAFASDVAFHAAEQVPPDFGGEILILATVLGPSVQATFRAYRCAAIGSDEQDGAFEEVARATLKISDKSEWRLAAVPGSPTRPLPGLEDGIVAGLRTLSREL